MNSEIVSWVGLALGALVAVAEGFSMLARANLRERFSHVDAELDHLKAAIEREERDRKESVSGIGRRIGDAESTAAVASSELVRLGSEVGQLEARVAELRAYKGSTPVMPAVRPPFPSRPEKPR